MGWLLTTLLFLSAPAPGVSVGRGPGVANAAPATGVALASAGALLPSRDLVLPPAIVQNIDPQSFDLLDARDDALDVKKLIRNEDPHSMFVIKRHIGASFGYDNSIVHGSVGLYVTVAEWDRWNFGIPSVGVGWGRYPVYDRAQGLAMMKNQPTVFVSIASIHYRVNYLQSLGMNWYVNLEQVYDLRYNMTGSQFGISLSNK